jgi:3-deoxy-D-manno-octulosonic acid kinase
MKVKPTDNGLDGRNEVIPSHISTIGNIVVKRYSRGGVVQHFQQRRYLKLGDTRCQKEYEMLVKLRHEEVNVPEPVAYVWKGWPLYKCWLITKKIDNHKSLAEIAKTDVKSAEHFTVLMIEQILKLIKHNIHHVDLHPGNVIVDEKGKVYIIDFDKAVQFSNGRNILRDKYIARWKRAVIKHHLPESLITIVEKELENIPLGL